MVLTTVFAPIAAIPMTSTTDEITTTSNVLSALVWHLGKSLGWEGWGIKVGELSMFSPGVMMSDMLWTLPTVPFAYLVIRYLEGRSSKTSVYITGVLSIIIPLVLGILSMSALLDRGFMVYGGPIPIQLIIGLLLVEGRAPQEKEPSPIDEKLKDHWWENKTESHSE